MSEIWQETCSNTTPLWSFKDTQVHARVVDVNDGDTIGVVFPFNQGVYRFKIRLSGINTAEIYSKDMTLRESAFKARNRVLQLLGINIDLNSFATHKDIIEMLQKQIVIVFISCGDFDKYGRILADVHGADGIHINSVLVSEGLATVYQDA